MLPPTSLPCDDFPKFMPANRSGCRLRSFRPRRATGTTALFEHLERLKAFAPAFVSCTYGAGGSTQTRTVELCQRIQSDLGIPATAHFTCVGSTVDELNDWLTFATQGGHRQHHGAARRSAAGTGVVSGGGRRIEVRQRTGRTDSSSHARHGDRRGRLSREASRMRRCTDRPGQPETKGRRGCRRGLHAVVLRERQLSAVSRGLRGGRHLVAADPGHHADHVVRPHQADHVDVRGGLSRRPVESSRSGPGGRGGPVRDRRRLCDQPVPRTDRRRRARHALLCAQQVASLRTDPRCAGTVPGERSVAGYAHSVGGSVSMSCHFIA